MTIPSENPPTKQVLLLQAGIYGCGFICCTAMALAPGLAAFEYFKPIDAFLLFGSAVGVLLAALGMRTPLRTLKFWLFPTIAFTLCVNLQASGDSSWMWIWFLYWAVGTVGALGARRLLEILSWVYHDEKMRRERAEATGEPKL